MKLKLQRVIKRLPETNYNVTEAAKREGYSKSYSETMIHTTLRKYIGVQSDEEIKDGFLKSLDKDIKRFKREKDNSNYVRTKEMKARTLGLFLDKSEVNNKSPEKTIIVYGNTPAPTIKEPDTIIIEPALTIKE